MNKRWLFTAFSVITLTAFRFGTVHISKDAAVEVKEKIPTRSTDTRKLGMDVTRPQDGNFDNAFSLAQTAGMKAIPLTVYWDDIETTPAPTYNPNPNYLAIANSYYPVHNTSVLLTIAVLDTTSKRVPADLAATPFDDPTMIARFKGLLDYVFTQIPNLEITTFAIGNEVDSLLAANATAWSQYETFYTAAAAYARTKRANLNVGTKATFNGLTVNSVSYLQSLNSHSDSIFVTYYPLNGDFTVKAPTVVPQDFQTLVSLYPTKPINFIEAGYPSSTATLSTEALQAQFIQNLFVAWDAQRAHVPVVCIDWMHDISTTTLKGYEISFGISDPAFLGYLGSIGLRTYAGSGSNKLSFDALIEETRKRGW